MLRIALRLGIAMVSLLLLIGTPTIQAQSKVCTHHLEGGLAVTTFGASEYPLNWSVVRTPNYILCHHPSEKSIAYVTGILARANTIIDRLGYHLKNVRPVVYLFPELRSDFGAAPWISTNFSVSDDVWMVYLSPSHSEWDGWGGGIMRHSIDDYHIRVLSNEYFEMVHDIDVPAPRWVQQGFTWYNGLFYFLDWEDTARTSQGWSIRTLDMGCS